MFRIVCLCVVVLLMSLSADAQSKKKNGLYEEVDIEDLMKRYFGKSFGYSIEGIYSVSCVITKRSKRFLSNADRIRVGGT